MSGTDESRITTDRERVRDWGREHDAVPVRAGGAGDEPGRLRIVSGSDRGGSDEELSWEEFFDELDRSDAVVVYHGDREGRKPFEVVDRTEAVGRASLDPEELERALLEGETVTSEVTETVVVEETVVEEATVESEVVDREVVEEEIVDAELIAREVADCRLSEVDTGGEALVDVAQFDVGHRTTDGFEIEVEVDEGWTVTKELLERVTVESRVVESGATEADAVVADTIDVEGVQRSVLASALVDSDVAPGEVTEGHAVESAFGEGETIRTQLLERKTVEEDVSLRKRLTGEVAEGETLASESIRREALESTLVDEDIDTEATEVMTGGAEASDAGAAGGEAAEGVRTVPSADDEGKTVVGPGGEEIGLVFEVEADTMYVDPHPSLTDRVKAALDWGEMDEEAYPIDPDQIAGIDDDHVELSIERSGEEGR